jgi:hypothetical protein
MAQSWAIKLYASQAWLDCRAAYIASVFGLCESCNESGLIVPGYICHHKVWLTPNNINDPNITLNHEHLRYECLQCHNSTHSKQLNGVTKEGLMFTPDGDLVEVGADISVSQCQS